MAPITNERILFNEVPEGFPEPGRTVVHDSSQSIDLDGVDLAGGFLIKTLYLSIDPYMRGLMKKPDTKSYIPLYTIGKPLTGWGLGVVLRSEHKDVKVGDILEGQFSHEHYFVRNSLDYYLYNITNLNPAKLPWYLFTGVLGMAGRTAYMAWKEYAHAKKGETVFVTTAAGPVGSLVVQIAKEQGLKVIASAGSDEKVEFVKGLGADVVFNYKTTNTGDILEKEGPVDIYWDNVGGDALDAALENANMYARFIECGMISGYNSGGPAPLKNHYQIIAKQITMSGFLVVALYPKYWNEFFEEVGAKVSSGIYKHSEQVLDGMERVGEAIAAVQKGTNTAKVIVRV